MKNLEWTPAPESNKFDQPKEQLSPLERGFMRGLFVGYLLGILVAWIMVSKIT